MAALTANRPRHTRNDHLKRTIEITGVDSDEFYSGGLISWSASAATVVMSSDTASERIAGVCAERFSTGSSNTKKILIEWGHEEWFPVAASSIVTGDEGTDAVVADDQTLGEVADESNDVIVGKIVELETINGTAGAWVVVGLQTGTTDEQTINGDLSITGTLGVTGTTTAAAINASGAVGVDGDFDVATSKFTVASASGNTLVAGTLDSTGDFDVNSVFTVAAASGDTVISGTAAVTGATTTTGGITQAVAMTGIINTHITVATTGTDKTPADGTQWVTSIFVPANFTCTNIEFLVGSVGGTDRVYGVIYDAAGTNLANSDLTSDGIVCGTAAQVMQLPLTATQALTGPATYYVGISAKGTTCRIRTMPVYLGGGHFAGDVAQTHATVGAITPPPSFTADEGPFIILT